MEAFSVSGYCALPMRLARQPHDDDINSRRIVVGEKLAVSAFADRQHAAQQ
jgi:hypothetical protein